MEPIRPRESGRSRRREHPRSEAGTDSAAAGGDFHRRLDSIESGDAASRIQEEERFDGAASIAGLPGVDAPTEQLFDAVHQAGQRLLDEQTYSAAQHYREAVRRFLGKVLAGANGIEVHESRQDVVTRKRFFLLTRINQSVDRLIEGLKQTQARQIDILARLEEIQGMLIDLLF
jgi:uncharacterized protein